MVTESQPAGRPAPRIGVLALQGAFREHRRALERLGASVVEVRLPAHLDGLDGLVVPGGESTTMAKLLEAYDLTRAIRSAHALGLPVWGTCAGAILLAHEIEGRPEQPRLDLLPIAVARNDYGRQVASFEADLIVTGMTSPFRAVFIRAPRITEIASNLQVLATYAGDAVAVRDERTMATVFHPELAGDDRFHALFLNELVAPYRTKEVSA